MKLHHLVYIVLTILLISGGILTLYMTSSLRGIPSNDIWSQEDKRNPDVIGRVSMEDGDDFRILLLTDIQLTGNPFKDPKALAMVDQLVQDTQPDLILTTGDNSYLAFADVVARRLIRQMASYDIPWGVTLGNHDAEGRGDRVWHGNQYENAENSLFRMGPSNVQGIGNYVIEISDAVGQPIYSIILMDSNGEREYASGKDYDYIYPDQIAWYQWIVKQQPDVPSMLVFHIPLPEFQVVSDQWEAGQLDNAAYFGENRERVCCPPENTGFFDVIKALENTTHIFVGHDHINSLSAEYEGVRLTYGLKTGPCSYSDDDIRGGTLITIQDGTHDVLVEHIYR